MMDYDSDLYYEHSEPKNLPVQSTKSQKRPRNLEDRVREYTGYVQDEDQDGPIYYSTERSSDSTSPFLVARGTGRRSKQSWRGTNTSTRGNTSPRYALDDSGVPLSERIGLKPNYGIAIRETSIDSDYLGHPTLPSSQPPDLLQENNLSSKAHRRSYSEDSTYAQPDHVTPSKECVVMPGFPVQTLDSSTLPSILYSPTRDKPVTHPSRFVCSWRWVSVCLTLVTLLLAATLIYYGAVKYSGEVPPPLPNSVIDSSGFKDSSCDPLINTQQEQSIVPDAGSNYKPAINIIPDQWLKSSLEPYSYWVGELEVLGQSFHHINITILVGGPNVAVYGRFGKLPSITKHDFAFFVNSELRRDQEIISRSEYLKTGNWFFAVFNDNQSQLVFGLVLEKQKERRDDCGSDCNGRGSCVEGRCVCTTGWTGPDCLNRQCPVLCSGHGDYGGGFCHCHYGWKGAECNLRVDECIVPTCSDHGDCDQGDCICHPGWTGADCNEKSCLDPLCSGHGSCVEGECECQMGWLGPLCQQENQRIFSCVPDCSDHGSFDLGSARCVCNQGWTGLFCNISQCSLDCGDHGDCAGNGCACHQGWTGSFCQQKSCNSRCEEHGECRNGTCICQRGWNGRFCGLEGCRQGCHGNGNCMKNNDEYSCLCKPGWTGEHCNLQTETKCQDGIDNDKDGLTDCGDSNCCSHPACSENIMCVYFADPLQVLLGKPATPSSASFFQRVKFLIEGDKSVQSYAKQEYYQEERASVVRGRVVTQNGEGIIGVRVSVDRTTGASNYGFTLTRPGGWFDMLVNGGGAVTLQFQRSPFKPLTQTSYVQWNDIHVLDPIIMSSSPKVGISWEEEDTSQGTRFSEACLDHLTSNLKPKVFTSPSSNRINGLPRSIQAQDGTITESIQIPGSKLYLVHHSSHLSTLTLFLTPQTPNHTLPLSLIRVHTKITVAGRVTRKVFEPAENIVYKFYWDKRNVYQQYVYSSVRAKVSVGYQYAGCDSVIWYSQVARMSGKRAHSTDIGGWDINIHHSINQGLVGRGDGSEIRVEGLRQVSLIGSGQPRDFGCETNQCAHRILNVGSITTGPDGSVYFGDYNMIRRRYPDGRVATILLFPKSQGSFLYDLTMSPADDGIYMTNSETHQVWKILKLEGVEEPTNNWEVLAGTGEKCTPGDLDNCGDGGQARLAKLTFPKGIAVNLDKTIFVTDGKHLRIIDQNGIISTLIGKKAGGLLHPVGCDVVYLAEQVDLHWPSRLALSPIDGSLYIVDENQILRLTSDMRLEVKAGLNMRCRKDNSSSLASNLELGPIIDIGFSQDGALYLAENRGTTKFSLHRIAFDGGVETLLTDSSPSANISELSSFAIGPGGNMVVADNTRLKVYSLITGPSVLNNNNTHVQDPVTGEIYVFNRFGQHVSTLHSSKELKYEFDYTAQSWFGQLAGIRDFIGNKILVHRDHSNVVQNIENTFGEKFKLKLNSQGYLERMTTSPQLETTMSYSDRGELLQSWTTAGDLFVYSYDSEGRFETAVTSTGEQLTLRSDSSCWLNNLVCYRVFKDGQLLSPSGGGEEEVKSGYTVELKNGRGAGSELLVRSVEGRAMMTVEMKGGLLPLSWKTNSQLQCNNTFDGHGRMLTRGCGSGAVKFSYGANSNRIISRTKCNRAVVRHTYTDNNMLRVIELGSRRKYTYGYDAYGGLQHVVLPNGGKHVFGLEQTPGSVKIFHQLPGNSAEFSMRFDMAGNLIQTTFPSATHITVRRYINESLLSSVVSGDRLSVYEYDSKGVLFSVQHERDISIKTSFSFGNGLLREQRINFDAKSALADAKFSYKYWNDRSMEEQRGRVGGQTIPKVGFYHVPLAGRKMPLGLGNFFFTNSKMNGTTLGDGNAIYHRTDSLVTLSINSREVFSSEYKYNSCNKLKQNQMMLKRSSEFFKQIKSYKYDDAGQLLEVHENTHLWKYEYDPNGNMKKLIFGKTEHKFDYDSWDQLVRYNQAVLSYDSQGRMVKNHKEFNFIYGSNNLLIEASHPQSKKRIFYFYDHLDRLVGWRDNKGRITQFYYSNPENPDLVSHIYVPGEDTLTSLVYDGSGNLIFAQVQEAQYYIISDQMGSPFLFFTKSGNLAKEINRSPFGQVTYDSNPDIDIPLGPSAGIVDPETGLLHIQRKQGSSPFDPFLGVYLVPNWEEMMETVYTPELFMVYRRNGNDPVNNKERAKLGLPRFGEHLAEIVPKLESCGKPGNKVCSLFTNLQKLAEINNIHVEQKYSRHNSESLLKGEKDFLSTFPSPSFLIDPVGYTSFSLARRDSLLGKYIVLRTNNHKITVLKGTHANQIYSSVFASVLDNSYFVNISSQAHGKKVFHLTKHNVLQSSDDIMQLRRLGSAVNITVHDGQNDNHKVLDVRLHLKSVILNIRYGVEALKETSRLTRHALRTLSGRVWERELERGRWNSKEKSQIQMTGVLAGYELEHIRSPIQYPELVWDLSNIRVVRGKRHRG